MLELRKQGKKTQNRKKRPHLSLRVEFCASR